MQNSMFRKWYFISDVVGVIQWLQLGKMEFIFLNDHSGYWLEN